MIARIKYRIETVFLGLVFSLLICISVLGWSHIIKNVNNPDTQLSFKNSEQLVKNEHVLYGWLFIVSEHLLYIDEK